MTDDEKVQWAKDWAAGIDDTAAARWCTSSPQSMEGIKIYADRLRLHFPDVSDSDLGRFLVWIGDFLIKAEKMYGPGNATPQRLTFTFAMTARELLKMDIEGDHP